MAEDRTQVTESQAPPAGPSLHVAPGPHIQNTRQTTRKMMIDVLIGLAIVMVPATLVFRQYAWFQVVLCAGSCIAAEAFFNLMRRRTAAVLVCLVLAGLTVAGLTVAKVGDWYARELLAAVVLGVSAIVLEAASAKKQGRPQTILDFSAVVTGVILAYSLPWNAPPHVGMIGSLVGIGIGKAAFGGVGMNLFNPAMVGRAFVMLAFTGAMGAPGYVYVPDVPIYDSLYHMLGMSQSMIDTVSGATPMTAGFKEGGHVELLKLLLGNTNGSVGETSGLACLIGGLYLCVRRTASWEIPAGALLAVAAIAGTMNLLNPGMNWTALHHLLGGALLLGAFFIVTDPVTSPLTPKGKFVFGLVFGCMVMLIRNLSSYPEGVMFSVLLVNAVSPLINRWTVPKPFGGPAPAPVRK